MNTLRLSWPCKLNLFLRVLRKRPDGYHDLATAFVPLSFGDELRFSVKAEAPRQIVTHCEGVASAENLVSLAYEALLPYAKNPLGFEVRIDKRVPVGSGLGGGSSNAAAALRVFNRLLEVNFDEEALSFVALSLGSDVPALLSPRVSFGSSRGERLSAVSFPNLFWILVFPGVQLSTRTMFEALRFEPCDPGEELEVFERFVEDPIGFSNEVGNDFEPLACEISPEVRAALSVMRAVEKKIPSTIFPRLSGSGSALVCGFLEEEAALAYQNLLQKEFAPVSIPTALARGFSSDFGV